MNYGQKQKTSEQKKCRRSIIKRKNLKHNLALNNERRITTDHHMLEGIKIPSELHSSSRGVMVWVIENFEKQKTKKMCQGSIIKQKILVQNLALNPDRRITTDHHRF